MSFLDEIISDKFKDNSGSLREENKDHQGRRFTMKCEINHKNNEYELYKFDKNNIELFPYFSDVPNLKKMNDYVLVFEKKRIVNILLIELKKSHGLPYKKQLIAGESFVRFLIHSYNRIKLENDKIKETSINFKKIRVIDEKSNKKRPTKGKSFKKERQAKGFYRHLNPKTFDFSQYA